ncbi:sensor domain-containing diguanylate cyclase [Dyella solisilvae]|uniref:Sensor domain-containing diguanylate cyclase n=2 Tax=Dyella solisilvae TaxID=1920168 RepID=A0A370K5X9_9GAMM|nr:sensor domain-containing diguanylate cyclase [Dyella solisilvae]
MTMAEQRLPDRPRLHLFGGAVALFVVVLVSDAVTLTLGHHGGVMASIWSTNGIVVGVLLSAPRRDWPLLLAITTAALLAGHFLALGALPGRPLLALTVLIHLSEILIVAAIVHRYLPSITGEVRSYQRFGRIAVGAALVGCIVSTLLAGIAMQVAPPGLFAATPWDWFRAHLLGMVIVGMLTLVALRERERMLGVQGRRLRMLRDVLLLAVITVGVFSQTGYPLLFLVFAPLIFLVFQHRFPGLVIGLAIVTLVTNVATSLGEGPVILVQTLNPEGRTLIAQLFLGVLCLVALPVALALADRLRLSKDVAASEMQYRLLAEYSSDLIQRIAYDDSRRYVSPSVKEILGWSPEEFASQGVDLIHPDDYDHVLRQRARLRETGQPTMLRYRMRNRAGGFLWIEALEKLAPCPDHPGETEVVYTGRDITQRALAEQALADSEKRLRTITDNVPAYIAHVDTNERYTFVNAYISQVTGSEAPSNVGQTVEEVRGPAIYPVLKPHIDAVLQGAATTFEYEGSGNGSPRYFEATYLPAIAADGTTTGFYTLTTDITRIKLAERKLAFLAHHDALTGIANRHSFRESSQLAIQHAASTHQPLLLMMIDVDFFKHINDTYGHAAGDVALTEVANRLKANIRKTDLVARLGGDEFVVLCHDIEDVATAERLAQQITDAMQQPVLFGTTELKVTLSIGVALCRNVASMEALSQRADEAVYLAKEAGRACFRLVSEGL